MGLASAILVLVLANRGRLPTLRDSIDAGAHAAVLPALTVASLVGMGGAFGSF